jgi:peptide/nickel transport system substrate-binding protein
MTGNVHSRSVHWRSRRTRRSLVLSAIAITIVAAALLAPVAAQAAANGRNLRYAYDLESITSLDPAKSGNTCDGNVWQFIYGNLIDVDNNGKLSPGLLESWTLSGKTLTLKLRPNLTFQDGEKLDSAALKSGLDWNNQNKNLTSLDLIQSIDIVDPLTVRLNLTNNNGQQVVYALSTQDGFMVAPNAQKNAAKKPVGAGPFSFVSYAHGSKLTLKRFPGYYDAASWKIPGVDFVQVGFGPEVVTKLKSGDVDVVRFLSESYAVLKADKGVGLSVTPSQQYAQFEFRLSPPFDNINARKAILYAIDRDRINKVVEAGQGEVTDQQFPKNSPFHDPSLDGMYTYDPAKAKQALKDAGLPNGFSFTLAIPGGNIANMERQGALIQSDLKAVGITAKIKRILPTQIATQFYIQKTGNAFSAEQPSESFGPNQFYGNFGKGQFVAIFDLDERQDITDLSTQAFQAQDPNQLNDLMHQMAKIVETNALDGPLVFVPQFAAWNKSSIKGSPVAPANSCIPTDLRNVSVK